MKLMQLVGTNEPPPSVSYGEGCGTRNGRGKSQQHHDRHRQWEVKFQGQGHKLQNASTGTAEFACDEAGTDQIQTEIRGDVTI
eukprot:CAMPEP_0201618844 /NCGR_PEP_ID=MMETSP0492-20130828/40097_1 /ASSEMBLY_ACC=CAM_ASM_000837 /TAXON_ID=420259 /ORGANISM="Thalassiosira gravida, Strain GMp14c1" /LENGTH=82 /DNA_ID=CAMNT_0048087561 /DNA_START=87 /DNA_END=335 /DNA_ORIENTATION=-